MSKTYYFLMGLVLLISMIAVIDGTEISGKDLILDSSNSSGTVDIVLDQVPAGGLAGYQIEINFSKSGITEFTHVNWPEAFSMNSASQLPSSSVNIVGVDLSDQIKSGDLNVPLATLEVKGLSDGVTDMKISIPELTDDGGSSIPATTKTSSITVGANPVTQVPTELPTASPTTSPTGEPTAVPPTEIPTASPTAPLIGPTSIPTTVPTTIPTTMPTPESTKGTDEYKGILKAEFSAMPQSGTPPLAVNFTDHSTGHPTKWEWNFGDGTMSRKQNPPTHIYGGIGRYTVTLNVSNSHNSSIVRKQELVQVTGDYPKGPSGFVLVTSNPSGAQVFTDNRYLGTTPSTLIVPAGSKALSYKKDGYMNKTLQVDIRPNEIKLVPIVILKPIPQ